MAFHEEAIRQIVQEARDSLQPKSLTDRITRFGGHEHWALIPGSQDFENLQFWNEFLRVTRDSTRSMVFRVLTRVGEDVESLRHTPQRAPVMTIDTRTNMERELEPMTEGDEQITQLMQAYFSLANGGIDAILTPVREGSLGPDKDTAGRAAHTTPELANNPQVWDIEEEVDVARSLALAHSQLDNASLRNLRRETQQRYELFAQEIAGFNEALLLALPFSVPTLDRMSSDTDWSFFSDQESRKEVDLTFGTMTVDEVVKYPYPTPEGTVYVRLFRVWSPNMKDFEVVRILQTQPQLDKVDGLRIDSSCVDGVHSLDSHCDCKAQLEEALYNHGLRQNKNVVIIMMADHEGKAMGTVNKGATHRIARQYNSMFPSEEGMDHIDSAQALYPAMDSPADARRYGAAQAVVKYLGLTHADEVLMDNEQKISNLRLVGFSYLRKRPLEGNKENLPPEARKTLENKKKKVITGIHGQVVYTGEVADSDSGEEFLYPHSSDGVGSENSSEDFPNINDITNFKPAWR